ncbi:MAG: DsbC family protein [Gammaproteobacteria bacterium]
MIGALRFHMTSPMRAVLAAALCLGALGLSVNRAAADESASPQGPPPQGLMDAIATLIPGARPDFVSETPIAGLYEVAFGSQIIYMTADGVHMLRGDLVNVVKRENLTENRRRQARVDTIAKVDPETMITFAPEKVRATLTVFTDVDCAYCAKLHQDVPALNERGIAVRYLAFPRRGAGSETFDTMVSVWCAADQREAMTLAKSGGNVDPAKCENPVSAHFDIGQDIGVRGTPTIMLDNGHVLPGYVPPDGIMEYLSDQSQG